jgi:hypothetical protein
MLQGHLPQAEYRLNAGTVAGLARRAVTKEYPFYLFFHSRLPWSTHVQNQTINNIKQTL